MMWLLTSSLALAGARGVVGDLPPPPGMEAAYAPRRVALVVGIDLYDDPALGALRFAAKDAGDLSAVLSDPAAGGFDVVSQLTGEVTRSMFWSAFQAIASTLHRDDTFFLFIAGHGTLDLVHGTSRYVMPSDGQLDRIQQTGIAVSELEQALASLPSRRRVLSLDTCFTGQGRSVLSAETLSRIEQFRGPVPPPIAARISESEVRLFSASFNQPALEDANLGNGVYTHFLIQALSGAGDLDGDGLVDVMEAFYWTRDRTLEYTGGTQVPWVETREVGREAIYLAGDPEDRRGAERALLTGLQALPAQAVITVDGAVRGAGVIEPGAREVVITDAQRTLVAGSVRVAAGESINVGALLKARQRRWLLEIGGDWRGGSDWLPALGPRVSAWYLPPDPGRGRPALGAAASYGLDSLPAGELSAQTGWWWGDRWLSGFTASGGLLWRVAPLQVTRRWISRCCPTTRSRPRARRSSPPVWPSDTAALGSRSASTARCWCSPPKRGRRCCPRSP